MTSDTQTASASKVKLWAGYILSAIPALLLLSSGVAKIMKPAPVVQGFAHFGYPESLIVGIGILEFACAITYLIPRTSVLGAILVTGYLGGAIASHVRIGSPMFSHTLFGLYLGLMVWGGLWLRDRNLRSLLPFHC